MWHFDILNIDPAKVWEFAQPYAEGICGATYNILTVPTPTRAIIDAASGLSRTVFSGVTQLQQSLTSKILPFCLQYHFLAAMVGMAVTNEAFTDYKAFVLADYRPGIGTQYQLTESRAVAFEEFAWSLSTDSVGIFNQLIRATPVPAVRIVNGFYNVVQNGLYLEASPMSGSLGELSAIIYHNPPPRLSTTGNENTERDERINRLNDCNEESQSLESVSSYFQSMHRCIGRR
jgi:hypothetical protein